MNKEKKPLLDQVKVRPHTKVRLMKLAEVKGLSQTDTLEFLLNGTLDLSDLYLCTKD